MNSWKLALRQLRQQAPVFTRVRAESDPALAVPRQTLDLVYDHIREEVDLVADRPEDGCFARAQVLSHELAKQGVESEKVFLTPFLKDLKSKDLPEVSGWRYHVATVAMTSDAGPQVLDPVLSQDPLPLETWFGALWQGGPGVVSVHEPSKYLNGLTFSRDEEQHQRSALEELARLQ